MIDRLLERKGFAVAVGWVLLAVLFLLWSYLSYDLLYSTNRDWFYRVNALLHEHPEPGTLVDPLFWVASFLGNMLVFGIPSALISAFFVPRHGRKALWLTVGVAWLASLIRKTLIWLSPTTIEIKVAAMGEALAGLAVIFICSTVILWRRHTSVPFEKFH